MDLGKRIQIIRKDQGMNAEEFAKVVGISPFNTLYKYENGRNMPRVNVLEKICSEFKVNGHWLITGQGEKYLSDIPVGKQDEKEQQNLEILKRLEAIERKLKEQDK